MKTVIITGATGFIGRHLTDKLSSAGCQIYAFVRAKEQEKYFLNKDNVHTFNCEISEISNILRNRTDKVDVFYHFAWDGVAGEKRYDYNCQISNIKCSCEALEEAEKIGCGKFILPTTIMEYETINNFYKNNIINSKKYVYGTAKFASHYILKTISKDMNVQFISAIVSNVYGPGEISDRLINTTIRKLLNHECTEFTTANQLYDFIYISDAIKAFEMIGKFGEENGEYYVGSRYIKPLKEYLYELRDCIDINAKLGIGKVAINDAGISFQEFDINKLFREMGFKCEVSFSDGIKKILEQTGKK